MSDCRYFQSTEQVWHKSISDYEYYTNKPINKWEVHGAFLPVSYHKTEEAARKEFERRSKLPRYTPPIGQRTGK